MIQTPLLFIHGWGFDARIWDPLRTVLPAHRGKARDLGYFGPQISDPAPEADAPVIAVTHSFGTMALLNDPPPALAALIVINGFPRFTEAEDYRPATPVRLVQRMRRRLTEAPEETLRDFRLRCGTEWDNHGPLDLSRLAADLTAMESQDYRSALAAISAPVLVLASEDDPIVPPGMTAQAFSAAERITLRWSADGHHVLPLSRPGWCAEMIGQFLRP